LVELGIPFSDPLADGPVIQGASQVALRGGTRPADVLELARTVASEGAQIVLLSYLNNVMAFGPERFFDRCRDCGVLGVVVPDLPVEEASVLQAVAGVRGISVILLAAPTSTEERLARIAAAASGFIYCVSTTGVTGARESLPKDLPGFVARIRRHTELPLAVGFGVSTVEQAECIAGYADGVIIGSALVGMVAESDGLPAGLRAIERYLQEVRSTPSFSR
jgi:tryptophan synthase alpha chain